MTKSGGKQPQPVYFQRPEAKTGKSVKLKLQELAFVLLLLAGIALFLKNFGP